MTSPAIRLAREMQADFTEASGAVTYFFGPDKLETFYAKAQAQALRDAAKEFAQMNRHYFAYGMLRKADELEGKA